ncbi:MAG: hypothetical protein WA116_01100 [Anaerolineaceae bacterium]
METTIYPDIFDRRNKITDWVSLYKYIEMMKRGNYEHRTAVYKIEGEKLMLVTGKRNYHDMTSTGRKIFIYYILDDGNYHVVENGKTRYIHCENGTISMVTRSDIYGD